MTTAEMKTLKKNAMSAAMRGARILDDRYGFDWVLNVKPGGRGNHTLLDQVRDRMQSRQWRLVHADEKHITYSESEIDGGYYGFYATGRVLDASESSSGEMRRALNTAWQKVVARRRYLRDLRQRRKAGLTPGTRMEANAGREAAL